MTAPVKSQRAHPRVAVDAFVKIAGGAEYVFQTRDLSRVSLFLYSRVAHVVPFRVGDTLALELDAQGIVVACRAVVVRVVERGTPEAETFPTGFALRITEISDDAQARLDALVAGA